MIVSTTQRVPWSARFGSATARSSKTMRVEAFSRVSVVPSVLQAGRLAGL